MEDKIADYIPHGYDNRVSRSELVQLSGHTYRKVRDAIAEENISGDEIIISIDGGYFIPDGSKEDRAYLNEYIAKEQHRAAEIKKKLSKIQRKIRKQYW